MTRPNADAAPYLKRCGRERAAVVAAMALLDAVSEHGEDASLSVDDAYALMTGFVDLVGWPSMSPKHQGMLARLLALRSARLANPTAFKTRAQQVLEDSAAPYASADEHRFVRATEMTPEAVAHAALDALAARAEDPATKEGPSAGPVRLRGYVRGQSSESLTFTIPRHELPPARTAGTALTTQEPRGVTRFSFAELVATAERIAAVNPGFLHLPRALADVVGRLCGADRTPTEELVLEPGPLDLLVAPTGVGKSVLVTVLATHAALNGWRVAVAVPDVATARKVAHDLCLTTAAVGLTDAVAAALTPDRVWGVVSRGLEQPASDDPDGSWTLEQFGYTCLLTAYEDERRWLPGHEPCRGELRVDGDGDAVNCPFLDDCARSHGQRDSLTAPIVVINHHALLAGMFHGNLTVDGASRRRVSMLEVVLRGCDLILVDEVDRLQVSGFSLAARKLDLANRGVVDTSLSLLASDLARMVPPAAGRLPDEERFRTVLRSTSWLADRYLALHEQNAPLRAGADGELHYALASDRCLAAQLLVDESVETSTDEAVPVLSFAADLLDDLCGGAVVDEGRRKELAERHGVELDVALASLRPAGADLESFERVRLLAEALVVPRALSGDPDVVLAEIATELEAWLPEGYDAVGAAHQLAHRAFRLHLNQWLRQLTLYLPGMERDGLASAGSLAEQLARPAGPQIIPLGPLGGMRFGFRVDAQARPRLSAQMATGDPHRTVSNLGDVVSLGLAGTTRVVIGLSATAWLPGAPRSHVNGRLRWAIADDQAEGLDLVALPIVAPDSRPVRISGVAPQARAGRLEVLGTALWDQHLRRRLEEMATADPARSKALIVTASYADADALALGLAASMGIDALGRVFRIVRRGADESPLGLTTATTIDRLPDFVSNPTAAILVAPLGAVARGHNIVGHDGRSALGAIYVCVRPIPPDRDPEVMLARVNSRASAEVAGLADLSPGQLVTELHSRAFRRLRKLISASGPFSRQPLDMRLEVIIELLADLVQLAGRARRGGTTATMYLVDAAFHEPGAARNASLGAHIAELVKQWKDRGQLDDVLWLYQATLGAFARLQPPTGDDGE